LIRKRPNTRDQIADAASAGTAAARLPFAGPWPEVVSLVDDQMDAVAMYRERDTGFAQQLRRCLAIRRASFAAFFPLHAEGFDDCVVDHFLRSEALRGAKRCPWKRAATRLAR